MDMDSIVKSSLFCSLLHKDKQLQGRKLARGSFRYIFSTGKYVRLGVFPNRRSTGNLFSSEQAKLSSDKWDEIFSIMTAYRTMYRAFLATEEVRRLHIAKEVICYLSLSGRECGPEDQKTSLDICIPVIS